MKCSQAIYKLVCSLTNSLLGCVFKEKKCVNCKSHQSSLKCHGGKTVQPRKKALSKCLNALTDPKLEVLAKFIPESPKMTPVKLVKFSRICFNTP